MEDEVLKYAHSLVNLNELITKPTIGKFYYGCEWPSKLSEYEFKTFLSEVEVELSYSHRYRYMNQCYNIPMDEIKELAQREINLIVLDIECKFSPMYESMKLFNYGRGKII